MSKRAPTVHIPGSLVKKVDQLAACIERSQEWIIKQALSAYIRQVEERKDAD